MYLLDYVRNVVSNILVEKRLNGEEPVATIFDIDQRVDEDILDCMRELHVRGIFKGEKTSQGIPVLRSKDDSP